MTRVLATRGKVNNVSDDKEKSWGYTAQDTYSSLETERKMLKRLIGSLQKVNRKLAQAEYNYKVAFSIECVKAKLYGVEDEEGVKTDPVAWTMTATIVRGLPEVAKLRYERDILRGEQEAVMQKIYQTKKEIDLLSNEMEAIQKGE